MTGAAAPLIAVLDANVLYPQWLRDVMLTLAAGETFEPVWSQQIIDESELAAVLAHLAGNRRGVSTISDVLDQLDRNQTLPPFVDLARTRLL